MSLISEIGLRLPFDKIRARCSDFSWSANSDRASTPLSPQFDINSAQILVGLLVAIGLRLRSALNLTLTPLRF